MIVRMDRIPLPGEPILGGEFLTAADGKRANQAVAAARAGDHGTFITRVGVQPSVPRPEEIEHFLASR